MKTRTDYTRIFPRDFFNEAKLLNCLGKLTLMILDKKTPCKMGYQESLNDKIKIGLRDDGYLIATNVEINIKRKPFIFKTNYNSKSKYPFFVEHNDCDYQVFNDEGDWDEEFLEFVKTIK